MTARGTRIGSKVLRREGHYRVPTHEHWCPACKRLHGYAVEQPFPSNNACWTFDGNGDCPSFQPSMNIGSGPFPDGRIERCHYFVTAGMIQYQADCTHEFAGQTLPLPDIDEVLDRAALLMMGVE